MKKSLLQAVSLFALNAILCLPLFRAQFLDDFQSNEGSWIALARFLQANFPHIRWYPWTDGGMPMEATYLPLIQSLTAIGATLFHASPALVFHFLAALFYSLAPVSLYLFAACISGRSTPAFTAALLWSLVSPSVLLPSILKDAGSPWVLRRLQNIVYWGETPHNVALLLVPLALLLMAHFWQRPTRRLFAATVLLIALVMLTNAFGIVLVGLGAVLLLASQDHSRLRNLLWLAGMMAAAYLLVCRALPPSLVKLIAANSQVVAGDYRFTAKSVGLGAALVAGIAVLWWLTRRLHDHMLRFSVLFLACFGGITILAECGLSFLPQPLRYHLEMEIGVCLVAGFAVDSLTRHLPRKVLPIAAVASTVLLAAVFVSDYRFARRLIRPADIAHSATYRQANWIAGHLPGRRIMVSGESSLWVNVFADNPQLSGGHEPSAPNWMQQVAVYTIYTGQNAGARDAEISVFWLKAFGCAAITVPGPSSRDHYHPFVNPAKFDGVLPVAWREDGDTIYEVPQRSASLAHVIPTSAVVTRRPEHGLDTAPAQSFVDALDDDRLPVATLEWRNPEQARLRAEVGADQAVHVQMTYDPGWHATREGRDLKLSRDALGMMVIETGPGGSAIDLHFEDGAERRVCAFASAAMLLALCAASCVPWRGHSYLR